MSSARCWTCATATPGWSYYRTSERVSDVNGLINCAANVHAAIELKKENHVKLSDIEEINVFVGDFQQRMCSPLAERQVPGTLVDAKFSLPILVALSLVKGRMDIGDFSVDALKDPDVLALAR